MGAFSFMSRILLFLSIGFIVCIRALSENDTLAPPLSLYGVGTSSGFQLVNISLKTGSQTKIGKGYPNYLNEYEQVDVDLKNNILYALLYDLQDSKVYLGGFQLPAVTKTVLIALPFVDQGFIGVGQTLNFNPSNGEVIVSGIDPSVNNSHHLISVNPQTSTITSIVVITHDIKVNVLAAASAFDWINNMWWSEVASDTGAEIFRISVNIISKAINYYNNTCDMESMHFDPTKGQDKKVADFKAWGLIWESTCALNYNTRLFYSILAPVTTEKPWHLVSVNIDTLQLFAGPVIDPTEYCTYCPQSLFFGA